MAEESDFPVFVADSGSKQVDGLVAELVSRRPAPIPMAGSIPTELQKKVEMNGRFATERVKSALKKLEEMGPPAFPYLLKHLEDERYCFSETLPSAVDGGGWMNETVGDAVYLVLSNEFSFVGGYKVRKGADGRSCLPLTFEEFLGARGGIESWVASVKERSREEAFTEFIDWCIAEEGKRGFASKEDETLILSRYQEKRKELAIPAPDGKSGRE